MGGVSSVFSDRTTMRSSLTIVRARIMPGFRSVTDMERKGIPPYSLEGISITDTFCLTGESCYIIYYFVIKGEIFLFLI